MIANSLYADFDFDGIIRRNDSFTWSRTNVPSLTGLGVAWLPKAPASSISDKAHCVALTGPHDEAKPWIK